MIRTIDIHTGHSHFESDVTVIAKECAVVRINIGGASVNIFGSLDRLSDIRRAAAVLNEAFGENGMASLREAAE